MPLSCDQMNELRAGMNCIEDSIPPITADQKRLFDGAKRNLYEMARAQGCRLRPTTMFPERRGGDYFIDRGR